MLCSEILKGWLSRWRSFWLCQRWDMRESVRQSLTALLVPNTRSLLASQNNLRSIGLLILSLLLPSRGKALVCRTFNAGPRLGSGRSPSLHRLPGIQSKVSGLPSRLLAVNLVARDPAEALAVVPAAPHAFTQTDMPLVIPNRAEFTPN